MGQINNETLNRIVNRIESWTNESQISREEYECFYNKYLIIHQHINSKPHHYTSEQEYNKACCTSSMILMHLLLRINQLNEQEEFMYQTKTHRRLSS